MQALPAAVLAAGRTDLGRGEPRVGLDQRPPIELTFIFELADELAPPGVPDRFRQAAVLHHLPRSQRLDHDDLVLVDDASRQLVEEVVAPVFDLLMLLREEERHEEFARSRHRHGCRADLAVEAAVLCEPDEPDLREPDFSRLDADRAVLVVRRVGRARFPSRLEHREAGRPGEELRERRVEVQLRVREREAVRLAQEREQRLVGGRCRRLPFRPAARLRLLVDLDAVLEQFVVDEAGAADRLDQELGLCRRGVEPIFVAFQHVFPSFSIWSDDSRPIPIPAEGARKSDGITNFCSLYLSQGHSKGSQAGDSSPTYAGLRPRRLEVGEFSPSLVKQNELHMRAIEQLLGLDRSCLQSWIVFSDRSTLKRVESSSVPVLNRKAWAKQMTDSVESRLSAAERINLYEQLRPYMHVSDEVKAAHIDAIQQTKSPIG